MSIDFDPSKLPADQFKAYLKRLDKEKLKRGPTGALKLSADLPEVQELVPGVKRCASVHHSDLVEVIDALLRALSLPYSLQSRHRGKASSANDKGKPEIADE